MKGLPIYHGVVTLIPGLFLLLVAAIALLPASAISAVGLSLKDLSVLLPSSALGGYLVGVVVWDLAYVKPSVSLWPFYARKNGLDPRHKERLEEANKVLKATGASTLYEYTPAHYRLFQTELIRVTETHQVYLGQRVSAEWERLGLYCGVALSCKLALLTIAVGVVIGRVTGYTPVMAKYLVYPWVLTTFVILLGLAVPLAFRRRNKYLGRDVGLGIADRMLKTQNGKPDCVILVDFDGVLADTNTEKAKLIKTRFGKAADPRQCSRSFCVPHILSEQEYESLAQDVYSPSVTLEMDAVAGAVEAIMMLHAAGWKTVVLTARSEERCIAAQRWLRQRFGPAAPRVHSSAGLCHSKAEWAAEAGALAIVDDDPRHLDGVASASPVRFLFNPPEGAVPPEGAIAVRGWKQLLEHLSGLGTSVSEQRSRVPNALPLSLTR